jgi:hypothetical protein
MTDDLPRRGENAFLFHFQEIGIAVNPARETESVEARRDCSRIAGLKRASSIHEPTSQGLIER